jgi:hypothetical protein
LADPGRGLREVGDDGTAGIERPLAMDGKGNGIALAVPEAGQRLVVVESEESGAGFRAANLAEP